MSWDYKMTYFEKRLHRILVTEDLDKRINQLVGMVNKLLRPAENQPRGNVRLRQYMKQIGTDDPEVLVRDLAQYDPSGTEKLQKGLYVQWIIKLVSTGQLRLPEDGERLRKTLIIFDRIKKSSRFEGEKDINKYTSFRDLEKLMKEYEGQLISSDEPHNLRAWFKWVEKQGVSKLYGDEKYTVLKFDPGEFQEYKENQWGGKETKITNGIQVISKKIVIGQGGQEINASWVPLWAATPEEAERARVETVTPTAMAVSRLATGSSWCVANPATAQSYLNRGPLYPIYKDKDRYLLADATWGEYMNEDDQPIVSYSPAFALFSAKLLRDAGDQLPEQAVKNIKRLMKRGVESWENQGYGKRMKPEIRDFIMHWAGVNTSEEEEEAVPFGY